jgi:hypothetical protein
LASVPQDSEISLIPVELRVALALSGVSTTLIWKREALFFSTAASLVANSA